MCLKVWEVVVDGVGPGALFLDETKNEVTGAALDLGASVPIPSCVQEGRGDHPLIPHAPHPL